MRNQFYRKAPSECPPRELAEFKAIVIAGGQVQRQGLESLIGAAKWLGFGWSDGVLASVAAIKRPRTSYRDRIFEHAQSPETAERFVMEFGWACTLDAYRKKGLSSGIADVLLTDIDTFIFATTGESNDVMKHILTKRGFQRSGVPYPGQYESRVLLVRKEDA